MVKHKKYGWVKVLAVVASNRGGLARIATPWVGRGPGRVRSSADGVFWVRASTVGCQLWR